MVNAALQYGIGLGVLQALLLAGVLLVFPAGVRPVSRALGVILFLAALLMWSEVPDLFGAAPLPGIGSDLFMLLDLLMVVAVWWLTLGITGRKACCSRADAFHLAPFVIGLVWVLTGFRWFGTGSPGSFSAIPDAVGLVVGYKTLVWVIYMSLALREIRYRERPREERLLALQNRLLQRLVWPFILISGASYLAFWWMYFGLPAPIDSDQFASLLIVAFVYSLTFSVLREPGQLIRLRRQPETPKYARSSLGAERSERYLEKLQALLDRKRPYLDEGIGLNDLAEELDIPANALSQVINQRLGKSFHDLMNDCRLREVKRKLRDPALDHRTILDLALESGFQSKASFNRIFRDKEGTTPSVFRHSRGSQPTF